VTTFVKHFIAEVIIASAKIIIADEYVAGYGNTTSQ
jgi:hypothetical protein